MSTRPASLSPPRLSLFYRQTVPVSLAGGVSFFPFPDTPLLSGCLLSGMLRCCTFNGGICNWIVIEFSWKWICQLYIYIYIEIKIEKRNLYRETMVRRLSVFVEFYLRLDKRRRISSIVSTVDRFSKRFNRRFSLSLAPISRFSLPPPPHPRGLAERERVLFQKGVIAEGSYRHRRAPVKRGWRRPAGLKRPPHSRLKSER